MNVGVLGSGDVGQVLGGGFAARGHDVKLGSRDPNKDKIKAWATRNGAKASTGTFEETAKFGEVLVLATLWDGTKHAIELAKVENFKGKILIDATNPLDFTKGIPPKLSIAGNNSAGEEVQRWLPEARVVKCFNVIGNAHMIDPQFPGGPPDMFIAGNDAEAKKKVVEICTAFGWPGAIDLGGIESSRYLEPLAMVWVLDYFRTGSPNHAFKMLRK